MSGSTGHPCPASGIWRSQSACHTIEIALSVGEVFPPCRDCKRAVTWVLIRRTHNQ
jgi:hypothetical protein